MHYLRRSKACCAREMKGMSAAHLSSSASVLAGSHSEQISEIGSDWATASHLLNWGPQLPGLEWLRFGLWQRCEVGSHSASWFMKWALRNNSTRPSYERNDFLRNWRCHA